MKESAYSAVQIYKRLLSYVVEYKGVFILAIIGMLVTTGADAGFVAMLKPIMDKGLIEHDPQFAKWLPLAICGIFVIRGIGVFTYTMGMTWVARKTIFTMRQQLFEKSINLPTRFYDDHSSAAMVSKLVYDVEQVASASTVVIRTLVKDSVLLVALLVWMAYLNYKLTLILMIALPLVLLIVRVASKKFRKTSRQIQGTIGEIANTSKEAFQAHQIVKIFGGHVHEEQRFAKVNEANRTRSMKKALISSLNLSLILLVIGVALAIIINLVITSSQHSEVSAGDFVSYLGAILAMLSPVKRLARVNETLQQGIAGADSVFAVIDEQAEQNTGTEVLSECKGHIVFKGVSFNYGSGSKNVLKDIFLEIKPNQTIALVGASGSGKSTVVSLLLRFYNLEHGAIAIDGHSITDIELGSLRSCCAIVTQEAILFDESIYNNIVYGGEDDVDETRLKQICDAAHVSEFLESLPQGLQTTVGERGAKLSGGQRQRIAIARAFYKNAPILILDEATSALDTRSERLVQQATQALMQGKTTIVIAHRLSTIENVDCIYVMDSGRIVESGTNQQLLDKQGYYYRLWQAQKLGSSDVLSL